jgi:predicted extracellular nuclease
MKFAIAAVGLVQILLLAEAATACTPTTVFINEIHYDNDGGDVDETIEIAGKAGIDVSGYTLVLYNGNSGGVYGTRTFPSEVLADSSNGFGFLSFQFAANGIQNGSPDGIALVDGNSDVVQFLSYEGSFTATDGPAAGMISTDIGVSETSSTPIGYSLQLVGNGNSYTDFTWQAPSAASFGVTNAGQTITSCGGPPVAAAPGTAAPVESPTTISPVQSSAPTSTIVVTIQTIQGASDTSPLKDKVVQVNAYVTAVVNNGFFMQEEGDGSAASSGIFVYTGLLSDLSVGDYVSVLGKVQEYFGMTQVGDVQVEALNEAPKFFDPIEVVLPISTQEGFEMYESMLVSIRAQHSSSIFVSEFYNFGRFGDVLVCSAPNEEGRPFQYTNKHLPDQAGYAAHLDLKGRSCVTVDDGISGQNPDPAKFGSVYSVNSIYPILRGGAVLTKLQGPLVYSFSAWRVTTQSIGDLEYTNEANPREQDAPVFKDAEVTVAMSNLLNYWTTYGTSSILRGADSEEEFQRQAAKTVLALTSMNADVLGVIELENVEGNVAALDLVLRLNAANSERTYVAASVVKGQSLTGSDAIKVDLLYDSQKMELVGYATLTDDIVEQINPGLLLDSSTGCIFACKVRVPVAVTLQAKDTGEYLTVVVNHYKSKGSGPESGLDKDQSDGAGNWNHLRTLTSMALVEWLKTNP